MRALLSLVVVCLFGVTSPSHAQNRIERPPSFAPLHDLGSPAGGGSDATDINNDGVIVGTSGAEGVAWLPVRDAPLPAYVAHLLSKAIAGVPVGSIVTSVRPSGINAAGQVSGVAGVRLGGFGPPRPRAVVWDSPTAAPRLLPMPAGMVGAQARAINDLGHVAGSTGNGLVLRAVVWRDGVTELLPLYEQGDSAIPFGINREGLVVGHANREPGGVAFPVAWVPTADGYEVVELPSLGGTPSGQVDFGRAVNDAGQVAGVTGVLSAALDEQGFPAVSRSQAFVWSLDDDATWLRPAPPAAPAGIEEAAWAALRVHGAANGINERSEMVGYIGVNGALDAGDGRLIDHRVAGYWRNGGHGAVVVGTFGPGLKSFARAINDRGEIVGLAEVTPGTFRAFVTRRLDTR